jgi:predicted nucleotidyltransferase/uncharacterized protein (DUF433 family)
VETILSIDLIVSNPDVRGGRPVIAGTGATVADVAAAMIVRKQNSDEIATRFNLDLAQVYAALAYYYAHKEEIDADLAPLNEVVIPKDEIAAFCERHHIRKLSLFGSVLRDDFRLDSDVDVLVEFEPDHTPGLITFSGIQIELSDMIEREVDLQTPGSLSPYFRQQVLDTAEVQYQSG